MLLECLNGIKTQNIGIEPKICIVKVLCICATGTEICQHNEYHPTNSTASKETVTVLN
jgi:hypothetical protein